MVGLSAMPAFLQRAVATTPMPNKKQLVVLFQRGAADGLNIVVPFGESNYYRMRPTIAIPQPKRGGARSEEHTSELQSRLHLVCRLLLEKKNTTTSTFDAGKDISPHHIHTHN